MRAFKDVKFRKDIIDGVYKHGNYGWLGKLRANEIESTMMSRFNKRVNKELALDVFHAHYLVDLSKRKEPKEPLKSLIEPIERDRNTRITTVFNELQSKLFTVFYIYEVYKKLQDKLQDMENDDSDSNDIDGLKSLISMLTGGSGGSISYDIMDKVQNEINSAYRAAKEKTDRTMDNLRAFSSLAGTEKCEFTLGDAMELMYVSNVQEIAEVYSKIGTIPVSKPRKDSSRGIVNGVTKGNNISSATVSNLLLPDELFYYRYATKSLTVRSKAYEVDEDVFILIDASGSMDGRRTTWARSVAIALLKSMSRSSRNVKVAFFNYGITAEYDFKKNPKGTIMGIVSAVSDGGTDIDDALIHADNNIDGTIVCITDGEDDVSYRPKNKLVSVMIDGDNSHLREVSDLYLSVTTDSRGGLKVLNAARRAFSRV